MPQYPQVNATLPFTSHESELNHLHTRQWGGWGSTVSTLISLCSDKYGTSVPNGKRKWILEEYWRRRVNGSSFRLWESLLCSLCAREFLSTSPFRYSQKSINPRDWIQELSLFLNSISFFILWAPSTKRWWAYRHKRTENRNSDRSLQVCHSPHY